MFAGALQDLAKINQKAGPIVGGSLAAPGVFAARVGQGLRRHQARGQCVGVAPVATHLTQILLLKFAQWFIGGVIEIGSQAGIGADAVQQAIHLGHRVRPGVVAAGGHQRRMIPRGKGLQVSEMMQALPGRGEGIVGGVDHG